MARHGLIEHELIERNITGAEGAWIECERALDEAMNHLENARTLSLSFVGSFSLPMDSEKLHLATDPLGQGGAEFRAKLEEHLRQLVDIHGQAAVHSACQFHAEAIDRADDAWRPPLRAEHEQPAPDFVLYMGLETVKDEIRSFRRHVIQRSSVEAGSAERVWLDGSCDDLERLACLFEHAWRVLSDGAGTVQAGGYHASEPVFRSARWFQKATDDLLATDTLRKAGADGRLQRDRMGKRWQYSVAQVKRRWPEHADKIDAALAFDRKCLEEPGTKRKNPEI